MIDFSKMDEREIQLYNRFCEIEKEIFNTSDEEELKKKRREWIHKEISKKDLSELIEMLRKQEEEFWELP